MAYIIPDKTGTVLLDAVDLSDYIKGVSITQSPETADVGVFSNPGATAVAKVTTEMSLVGQWSEAMFAAVEPLVGVDAVLNFKPTSASKTITATVRIEVLPWGDFIVGEPVEVEIPLSVVIEPTLSAVAAAVAGKKS